MMKYLTSIIVLAISLLSFAQSDSNYFETNHHLHFKELSPSFHFNCAPLSLQYNSPQNFYLQSARSIEFTDIRSLLSIDAKLDFAYLRLGPDARLNYDFGYNSFQEKTLINGELGFGITFRKEAVPAIKSNPIDSISGVPVKLRRYDARIGLKYQERHVNTPINIYNAADSTTYEYQANLKDRNLLLSIGVKARVTKRNTPVNAVKGKTKNRDGYFYLDVLFPIYFIPHEITQYNADALNLNKNLSSNYLDEGRIIPAGVRLGYFYKFRQKHSFYIRAEAGIYPGRTMNIQQAIGSQLTIGYSLTKLFH